MAKKIKKNEMAGEMTDLIKALRPMNDAEGCLYLLERLEILSRFIDETIENEEGILPFGDDDIITFAYWQRKIIDEIRVVLEAQDAIISKLQRLAGVSSSVVMGDEVKPPAKNLAALRHLASLFVADNLFHTDSAKVVDLKAWASTYGCDFGQVQSLLRANGSHAAGK